MSERPTASDFVRVAGAAFRRSHFVAVRWVFSDTSEVILMGDSGATAIVKVSASIDEVMSAVIGEGEGGVYR